AIFSRELTMNLPLGEAEVNKAKGDRDKAVQNMIKAGVEYMYRADDDNRFLEVTYQNGDKEILYFKDFASGAMIMNIVQRAKKLAIKRRIADEGEGIRTDDLLDSIRQEYKEHEDLPNTTNPDDWAKISGKKGERIVYVRTLLAEGKEATGGRSIERVGTGQYLWETIGGGARAPAGRRWPTRRRTGMGPRPGRRSRSDTVAREVEGGTNRAIGGG